MKVGSRSWPQVGVTLTELAVAVVVIAILIAVAIPRYRQHVLRVKSEDAPRELLMVALRLQGCHKRTGSYARLDDVSNACVMLPYEIPEGTYRISGDIMADAFLLTAMPIGRQADDAQCSAFTLDHLGQQGVTGTGTALRCWEGRQS
jgi:type IV pilus assembly protein PilE